MSAIRVFVGEKNAHKRTTLRTGIEFDLLAESHEPLNPIVKLGNSDCEIPAPNKKPIAWWEGRKDWSFEADCHVLIKCIWYIYILYLLYLITKDSYSIKRQTKRQIYHPFDTMGYWKWKISSFAFIFLKTISLAPEKWMVGRLFFMGTFVIFFLEVSLSHTLSMYGIFLYI